MLVEGADRVLPSYPQKLSDDARKMLVDLGVTVRTGAMVTDINAEGVTIKEGDNIENILHAHRVVGRGCARFAARRFAAKRSGRAAR